MIAYFVFSGVLDIITMAFDMPNGFFDIFFFKIIHTFILQQHTI